MAHIQVKVKLKEHVTNTAFWRATYYSDSNLGIKLLLNFDYLKNVYLDGKLSRYGSLEVTIPISIFNKDTKELDDDFIEYGYIQDSKDIWEIIEI